MDNKRWKYLIRHCNQSLLSYVIYIYNHYRVYICPREALELFEGSDVTSIIQNRINEYICNSFTPKVGSYKDNNISSKENAVEVISKVFQISKSISLKLLQGFNCRRDSSYIVRFTDIKTQSEDEDNEVNNSNNEDLSCLYNVNEQLMSDIYDFILQEQLIFLDILKYMFENASNDPKNFVSRSTSNNDILVGQIFSKKCFEDILWNTDNFNILDKLWEWYKRLVNEPFCQYEDIESFLFGNPLIQCYRRMKLESSLLHTILVILQAWDNFQNCLNKPERSELSKNTDNSLYQASSMSKIKIILSELQSRCFLGSLYTLYSVKTSGISSNDLTIWDNSLAHSSKVLEQLRHTASNGILLGCYLILALSPKTITDDNENLGFITRLVMTIIECLISNETGEKIIINNGDILNCTTPTRNMELYKANNFDDNIRIVRGNLLLAHARVVKPLFASFLYSYATIVALTPNRDALLSPIFSTSCLFESTALSDSIENILLALHDQNPINLKFNVKSKTCGDTVYLGEEIGSYYQHLTIYSLIRSVLSTFSIDTLFCTSKITRCLNNLLWRDNRLVYRECWRGDYYRHIGIHILLDMYISSFPYGIVEFLELLQNLIPDFTHISKNNILDMESARNAFKIFMDFIRTPLKCVNFSPYLESVGLRAVPINEWTTYEYEKPQKKSHGSIVNVFLQMEITQFETPNINVGSTISRSALSGSIEGCLLDILGIKLEDVTPLLAGFPNSRRCLTPLRILPCGISKQIPMKSMIVNNDETKFSSPVWATSPYGNLYDVPDEKLPPFYQTTIRTNVSPNSGRSSPFLDYQDFRLPSNFCSNPNELTIGTLDPFVIYFNCNQIQNSGKFTGHSTSQTGYMPSLLHILLFLWDSLGLYINQIDYIDPNHLNMLSSISEVIFKLVSFHPAILLILETELTSSYRFIPSNLYNTRDKVNANNSVHFADTSLQISLYRFGVIPIKCLFFLKGISYHLRKDNIDNIISTVLKTLPRIISLLTIFMIPIHSQDIETILQSGNLHKLHSNYNSYSLNLEIYKNDCEIPSPWSCKESIIPMYWLIPLLLSSMGSLEVDPIIQQEVGVYASLLRSIMGFDIDDFLSLATEIIETVEKLHNSYPITFQMLVFLETLMSYCPVYFWGLGWSRHANIILIEKYKVQSSGYTSRYLKDLQCLVDECIIFQSLNLNNKDLFEFFNRILNYTIRSVLIRISSWQFNVDSERNSLLLQAFRVFDLLLKCLDPLSLIREDMDKSLILDEVQINSKLSKTREQNKQISSILCDIIPDISIITCVNQQALIANLLKHCLETNLIPSMLSVLLCEYHMKSSNSRTLWYVTSTSLDPGSIHWELSISSSFVHQTMNKVASLSYNLALKGQNMISLDSCLAYTPIRCPYTLSYLSGESFAFPQVIVAQQVITVILCIVNKILTSLTNTDASSQLITSLRRSVIQWILFSYDDQLSIQISQFNDGGNTMLSKDFVSNFDISSSEADIVAQFIYNRVILLSQSKAPQMNIIKSWFVYMFNTTPNTLPISASINATQILSSFCYLLEFEYSNQPEKIQILQYLLKPPSSLHSKQEDFLLCLSNTKLVSLIINILYRELDFVLVAPIHYFINEDKFGYSSITFANVKAIMELLNVLMITQPSVLLFSSGHFDPSSLKKESFQVKLTYLDDQNLRNKSAELKPAQGYNSNNAYSRIELICDTIKHVFLKIESSLSDMDSKIKMDASKFSISEVPELMQLFPDMITLLFYFQEDSRAQKLLYKHLNKSENSKSFWEILFNITKKVVTIWTKLSRNSSMISSYPLATLWMSCITSVYSLISRFIDIDTNLALRNSAKLPEFISNKIIWEFVQYMATNPCIITLLSGNFCGENIKELYNQSIRHLKSIKSKLNLPIHLCIPITIKQDQILRRVTTPFSLEEFLYEYYFERYWRLSHKIMSSDNYYRWTEFGLTNASDHYYSDAIELDPKLHEKNRNNNNNISIFTNEISQLASLEIVWESGQLLAPKQHSLIKSSGDLDSKIESNISTGDNQLFINKLASNQLLNNSGQSSNLESNTDEDITSTWFSLPIHLERNASFLYKTKRWGNDFEVDLKSLAVLLSCSTVACLSLSHSQLAIQEILGTCMQILNSTLTDNNRRSFVESIMYCLVSYNRFIFYLKSNLPHILVNSYKLINKPLLNTMTTLFRPLKIPLTKYFLVIFDKDVEDTSEIFPSLFLTCIYSIFADIITFDIISSARSILGNLDILEMQKWLDRNLKKIDFESDVQKENTSDKRYNIVTIAPNSSSVCLSYTWQSRGDSIPYNIDDNLKLTANTGNILIHSVCKEVSEESESELYKHLPLVLEQACLFLINVMSHYRMEKVDSNNCYLQPCTGRNSIVSVWSILPILSTCKDKSTGCIISDFVSSDLISCTILVQILLRLIPQFVKNDDFDILSSYSTNSKLLELTSISLQFILKNSRFLSQNIRQEISNLRNYTSTTILPYSLSLFLALPIICLTIPTFIVENMYINKLEKVEQQFLESEFTGGSNLKQTPFLTKMKAILESDSTLDKFTSKFVQLVLPLLVTSAQSYESIGLTRNLKWKNRNEEINEIPNSLPIYLQLSPSNIPCFFWDEMAHYSMLNSILSCLMSLASSKKGSIAILESDIINQLALKTIISKVWQSSGSSLESTISIDQTGSTPTGILWTPAYSTIKINGNTFRAPLHIIWCRFLFLITTVVKSIHCEQLDSKSTDTDDDLKNSFKYHEYSKSNLSNSSSIKNLHISPYSQSSYSESFHKQIKNENFDEELEYKSLSQRILVKFMGLVDSRIRFVIEGTRVIGQLALLEEFSIILDLLKIASFQASASFMKYISEILQKSLRMIRNISAVSLGKGIAESFDIFKPISTYEKIAAGLAYDSLMLYPLDRLPALVPSIYHQRYCMILLTCIMNILDIFLMDCESVTNILLTSREFLAQLFHDTMDLGRPLLQLLEDLPNHSNSVLQIVRPYNGVSLLPLALNLQVLRPFQSNSNDLLPDGIGNKVRMDKDFIEYGGISRLFHNDESCSLPELITVSSFIQFVNSIVDAIALCGIKCLYILENSESTDQHNDAIRRLLEFLYLSQGMSTSSSLLNATRKLIERIYLNLKAKLGDQINVEIVGLAGVRKDPVHAALFERLCNPSGLGTTNN
ncbi:uncharacterized protein CMU_019580 [Cryptosporidium muris RN66]|uniref:Uncharacterized protein n=1 Tax=Cryptosporidium muris (strain RN66) TaxID=441375 RepID=B6ACE5_CRYMR|nr:uncharacterized protein CMU_019580 [Cryptosporidium muris RN66]EEA06201.1 hypothetical protein, conserved [Cryptosporidium muris RN66]|eukprot:XP_002140550.1 hypothetical protein [Cryptosporidium muris RN66]